MASLKSKYQRKESELIDSLIGKGKRTFITQIQLIETSKFKDHLIYDCTYVDNGTKKQINIIAVDISDAVSKVEQIVDTNIPEITANVMLGSEIYNKV